ncbi:MAG: 2,3-bisphosphoglycerate-independent phosphoglycerate mutase [Firmicutes bacterium]|nr:2,3-bisphosphoglycerate-independent phosphoglycerate mutase [Bacillota bacterium]
MTNKKVFGLIIMDGFGVSGDAEGNAIKEQGTPGINALMRKYPHSTLSASGRDVGLPEGQMGNSEVGHLNIGAGRIVYQDITMIDKSIEDGDFFENAALIGACENARKHGTKLHLCGLVSDGGVHSSLTHLYALLELAKRRGVEQVFVHCLLDGRDTPPASGAGYLRALQNKMAQLKTGKIGSVIGRYYLMDRDNRWERVQKGFDCMTAGIGDAAADPVVVVEQNYAAGITDEFMTPTAIVESGKYAASVDENDSVVFFNFRSDRAREVTRAFIDRSFSEFDRVKGYIPVYYTGMTQYDASFTNIHTAYPPKDLKSTLGQVLSDRGYKQFRIAETEKYAHVTFFFNGGVETPNAGENRVLIPSPKVATYDQKPEMSAYEVTEAALENLRSGEIDVMILNFANCDMVGHTGVMSAAVKAVGAVDNCVSRIADCFISSGGVLLIAADHGNAERMVYADGSSFTAHTTNPVPFVLIGADAKSVRSGRLCDLAPTLLKCMGVPQPGEMTGEPLF